MNETQVQQERALLVCVADSQDEAIEYLMELEELVETAGVEVLKHFYQNSNAYNRTSYIGKGKIEEIKIEALALGATVIIFDDELTPSQQNFLEKGLDMKVIDRTTVILDIFADRAITREGKLQVELAQLRYRLPRLHGQGIGLSRLGGGIGTRGPGEKKLETDKRHIRELIGNYRAELSELRAHRNRVRESREESGILNVAIVGYTNSGKSTLLNQMTAANVLEEDKLFATLDPTTRRYTLGSGREILLTDTVGFIRKLPHNIVEAFHSTLEEAYFAHILVQVVDAADPKAYEHMDTTYQTLHDLQAISKPIITIFNKCDKENAKLDMVDERADIYFNASLVKQEGLATLDEYLEKIIRKTKKTLKITLPYTKASLINLIREQGELVMEDYREDGIYIEAYVDDKIEGKVISELKK